MLFLKCSDAIKGPRVKVDGPLCGGLYKEDCGYIVPWSGTDPDAKLKCFTWSKEENYWIFQVISTINSSRPYEDLFMMINYTRRPSRRREE